MSRLLVISLCAVVFLSACSTETPDTTTDPVVDTIEVESDVSEESDAMEEEPADKEDSMDEVSEEESEEPAEESELEAQAATYVTYSEEAVAEYAGSNKVIFFHATWCPACRALDAELSSDISELPAGTVVMKADYDAEADLKQKYGVNLQHTLVFIDDEGNSTRANLTGADLDKLKAEL